MAERPKSAFYVDGNKIRLIRDRAGLTQMQLAADVATTPANMCRIERGEQQPSIALRGRILARLGISLDDVATPRPAKPAQTA